MTNLQFEKSAVQRAVNLFAFLVAFPSIEIFGNSLYFYIFLWILFLTRRTTGRAILKSNFASVLLIAWIFGLVSTVLHPKLSTVSTLAQNMGMFLMLFRYAYWFAIGAYFYSWLRAINLYKLSKYVTLGYLVQVFGFYVLNFKLDLAVITIDTSLTRNAFVFSSILFSGMVFYYFTQRYSKKLYWLISISIFFNLLLTNGRAGAVIAILIILLNYAIIDKTFLRFSKIGILILLLGSLFSRNMEQTIYSYGEIVAPYVENYSPRFASLLVGEDEGDLDFDKSWLIRELMIDKTIEIIGRHPFLGVGLGNFRSYDADLLTLETAKYQRLRSRSAEYFNTRSAHNSYANHLAETGLIGFVLLLLLLMPVIFWFLNHYGLEFRRIDGYEIFIVVGLIGGLVHGYAISAFTGANLWLALGISRAIIKRVTV